MFGLNRDSYLSGIRNPLNLLMSMLLAGLVACGESTEVEATETETEAETATQEPLAYTPDTMGAWKVGVTDLTGVGPDGEDSSLLVWYPTQADDGTSYSYLGAFPSHIL